MATCAALVALALPTGAAHAMESSTLAEENDESNAVVSEKITDDGSFGDCTGTAIAPHWVLTAQHCIQQFPTASGQVRIGQGENQRTVTVDRWEAAPAGDFALLHTAEDMGLSSYPKLATTVPSSGEATMYGWSPDGSGGDTRLPTAQATIDRIDDFGLFGGQQSIVVTPHDGAEVQSGDSGGPVFVNGEVAGVLSASLLDPDTGEPASNTAAYAPVAEQHEWIMSTINGEETGSGGSAQQGDAMAAPGASSGDLSPVWLVAGALVLVAAGGGTYLVTRRRPAGEADSGR
ncbi:MULTISPECIES: trypsin-like serine protease [unclassified Actinomyces]|uniref:trypsin-like serine protease n=1 Tax=unclassified Actinomyces TaxID=2609248 RepID=UPI002016F9F1|nr:trypsin-like serine protease [Actinomyces sp. 187325]MCL3778148.1 trypsin-like serine protease [Actinomyces sp. AC-20-1]